MIDPSSPELDPDASELQAVRRQLKATRAALHLCLVAGLFTSAGVGAYLAYQLRQLMKETDARTGAIEQIHQEEGKMDTLVDQLRQVGRTYPDYAPVLGRVGLLAATSAPPASVLAPAVK